MAQRKREYLFEFHQVGRYVKVSAIDTLINTEVSVVGAASAAQSDLCRLAVCKLKYVLVCDAAKQGC